MRAAMFIMAAVLLAAGQAQNFDRLAPADHKAFAERFEKEVWPLMTRGGKDGCVSCHAGKGSGSLKLSGAAAKDFARLLKEGFFIPGDAGSLLERITDPSAERRMPLKKTAWPEADVKVLRAFVTDLDKKQRP